MSSQSPSVVYVLPDKMGGIASNVADLLAHRQPATLPQHAVLVHNQLSTDVRCHEQFAVDRQIAVQYSLPTENLHAVLRRLARAIPPGPGVLVANDWLELAMISVFDPGRTVVQILHGDYDYYYDLSLKHAPLIDAFVAITRCGYEHLRRCLPERTESIFLLPFGVPVAPRVRTPSSGPLRLLFVGRLDRSKGVFALPRIDALLEQRGIQVVWTIIGDGPDRGAVVAQWNNQARVQWLGLQPSQEVRERCADHDVFVLPSHAEGLPRAVLEAMSAGVVPVVSDIPGGVHDVVQPGVSGCLAQPESPHAFAAAIAALDHDRQRLEAFSRAARQTIVESFDIRERVRGYDALYARWHELSHPRPARGNLQYGSRLDHPWIPNAAVYTLRATRRWLGGVGRA